MSVKTAPSPRRWLLTSLLCMALVACANPLDHTDRKGNRMLSAGLGGANHTDNYIDGFSVNGAGGPNVPRHGGGGAISCCVMIPEVWRPGVVVIYN